MHFMKIKFYCALLICFVTQHLYSQSCNDTIHLGKATYYGGLAGSSGGNCGLPVGLDDTMHCALNAIDYDGSNACGACISVKGVRGTVVLKVVDLCPECEEGAVDMTQEAFGEIADLKEGFTGIEWKFVPCGLKKENDFIKIQFKRGSSQNWTAIQFRDLEHAVSSMEYKTMDEQWIMVDRTPYNFYVDPSGIQSPMDLRVTSILGEQLIFEDVTIDTKSEYDTGQQFSTSINCQSILENHGQCESLCNHVLSFYPNPVQNSKVLFLENSVSNDIAADGELTVRLLDLNGRVIIQELPLSKQRIPIDISYLASGMYLVQVFKRSKLTFAKRLIVK